MRTLLVAISLAAVAGTQTQRPVIRSAVTYVTTDLVVKNDRGQFVANLGKDDFDVFEDGVKQKVVTFVLSHGGQILKDVAPDSVVREGVLLPPARPASDSSGRIFLIFVDDLHMNFRDTGRIRELFKKITQELVHEGDLFGMVSSGPSSIVVDLTYDRKRLDEAIRKISGAALKPDEIISTPGGIARAARGAVSRARRVLHRLRRPAEAGAGPQPPQGAHLRQQRLRFQSLREGARGGGRRALRRRHATPARSPTPIRSRRPATNSPPPIWSRSWRN